MVRKQLGHRNIQSMLPYAEVDQAAIEVGSCSLFPCKRLFWCLSSRVAVNRALCSLNHESWLTCQMTLGIFFLCGCRCGCIRQPLFVVHGANDPRLRYDDVVHTRAFVYITLVGLLTSSASNAIPPWLNELLFKISSVALSIIFPF